MPSQTDEQINDFKEAFSLFDRSGNGQMESKFVGDLLRALGYNPTQAQVKEMISNNLSNAETISFNQFVEFVEKQVPNYKFPNPTLEELVQGFQVFDKEGNGYISVGELRYVLTSLGEKLSDDEVDDILKQTDVVSKEGFIHYEDFVKKILTV